jgi:hypothetical protein
LRGCNENTSESSPEVAAKNPEEDAGASGEEDDSREIRLSPSFLPIRNLEGLRMKAL